MKEACNSVVKLPGCCWLRRKSYNPKANSWNLVNGVRIEQKEGISFDKPKFVKVERGWLCSLKGKTFHFPISIDIKQLGPKKPGGSYSDR